MSDSTNNAIGTASGWTFETESNNPKTPETPYPYTTTDFYIELRKLLRKINPEYLQYLEDLIGGHIQRTDNPHKLSLEIMGTNVINELYKEWKKHDPINNIQDLDFFCKILFQYIRIASIDTTIEGKVMNQIPSVRAVAELLKRHNEDPYAHEDILNKIFVGQDAPCDPSFSLDASCGLPASVTVIKTSDFNFINKYGLMETATGQYYPMDYTYGDPAYPVWGGGTNFFKYSMDLTHPIWATNGTTKENKSWKPNIHRSVPSIKLAEVETSQPVPHVIQYNENIPVNAEETFTVSVYVRVSGRYCFSIDIYGDGSNNNVRFDLLNSKLLVNSMADQSRLSGEIIQLGEGFFRCSLTYRPTKVSNILTTFYMLDILDGDLIYNGTIVSNNIDPMHYWDVNASSLISVSKDGSIEGTNTLGLEFSLPQFEKCAYATSFIPTTDNINSRNPISLIINKTDLLSGSEGTIVIEFFNSQSITKTGPSRIMYSLHTSNNIPSVVTHVDPNDPKREVLATFTETGSVINYTLSKYGDMIRKIHVSSFNGVNLSYAGTNTPPTNITFQRSSLFTNNKMTLGCSRYNDLHFNGLIKRLVVYPKHSSLEQLAFLVEVAHE